MSEGDAAPDPGRRLTWAAALLFGATVLAYLPALPGGFVFDDITFLVQNNLIRAGEGLARFWFSTKQTDYWPVTYTALWTEWRLWGPDPLGYHAVNVALHPPRRSSCGPCSAGSGCPAHTWPPSFSRFTR